METLLTQLRIPQDDLNTQKYLGTGAFGAVFLGLWKSKNCNVAIKMVYISDKEAKAVLCNELNNMANLRHKHICQLYGVSIINDEEIWLVLEYVDGPNLHDYIISNGPVAWEMQLYFALQVAKAISYLHSQNPPLLHKDIKSLSLIVETSTGTIKLTDFGISKASEFVSSQTNVIGSLRWAAPEIVNPGKQKEPKWTEKADIYSLGMVFFEIIASEFPFRYDSNFGSIAKKIKRGMRPVIPQHCPARFAEIMLNCWEPEPEKRPTSKEIVAELEELANESRRTLLADTAGKMKTEFNFSADKNKSCVVQ